FAADLTEGLHALPAWLTSAVVLATWVLAVVVLLGGLVVVVLQGRWRALGTIVAAGVAAAGVTAVLSLVHEPLTSPSVDLNALSRSLQDAHAPTELALGVVTAIVTAASPWVSRPWRRLAWLLVLGLLATRTLISTAALESLRAVLVGWVVGAAVVVVLGGPARRAQGPTIAAGMAGVGLPLRRLEQASLDARGSTPYFGETAGGDRLFVKVLGRDERSADLLFRVYRRILPRDLADERGYLSLRRAVEHEALLALAARAIGIRTPRFLALADVQPASFVLTYEAIAGKSLDRLDAADVTDEILGAIWSQVALLRAHRVAHRDLRLANLFLGADGTVWLIDFGFSELAASGKLLATDVAELLASSSVQVGVERAVSVATAVMGSDVLVASLDRLQTWALAGATREALKERPQLLDELRARVASAQ
ncbi:MAG: TIGR00374 family protein, partial [Acidimicrobiales bacterium]